MREIVELLRKKGEIFREFQELQVRRYGIKKRWRFYEGVDLQNRYTLVVQIERKSRFLQKDAQDLLIIDQILSQKLGHGFAKRIAIFEAPLCSKASQLLQERGWRVVTV